MSKAYDDIHRILRELNRYSHIVNLSEDQRVIVTNYLKELHILFETKDDSMKNDMHWFYVTEENRGWVALSTDHDDYKSYRKSYVLRILPLTKDPEDPPTPEELWDLDLRGSDER